MSKKCSYLFARRCMQHELPYHEFSGSSSSSSGLVGSSIAPLAVQ